MSAGDRLEKGAWWLDRRPALIVALLAVIYAILIAPSIHRHLWYDELHTFYIAQASTLRQFIDEIRLLDLNPPLTYLLVRASLHVFGPAELGARMPVILGYFLGSMGMFIFIARRAGALWAAAGVGLLWYSQSLYYATEARPYGVLLGFLGLILMSWDYAASTSRGPWRRWALAGVAAGVAGMLLSHVYAALWIAPFWAAELIRGLRRGKMDWPLMAALILPMAVCLTYVPLIQTVGQTVFPPSSQGSPARIGRYYLQMLLQVFGPLVAGAVAAFAVALWRHRSDPTMDSRPRASFRDYELVLLLGSILAPVFLNLLSMFKHVAFYERHALPTLMMGYLLFLLFVAYESRANRLAGLAAALVTLGFALFPTVQSLLARPVASASVSPILYDQIHPELPFVNNSALTFLEMDHYENPALVARMYFLVDPQSAIQYDHTNLTEGLPVMKQYFPIRANVSSYSDFTSRHRHFLVWGMMDRSGWLLRKLKDDGAQLTDLGVFDTPYFDSQLYEVRLDP